MAGSSRVDGGRTCRPCQEGLEGDGQRGGRVLRVDLSAQRPAHESGGVRKGTACAVTTHDGCVFKTGRQWDCWDLVGVVRRRLP